MIKILYISEILGPHDYRFLKTNIDRGYEVTLLTYRENLDQAGLEGHFYDVRNIAGLEIIHNPRLAKNSPLNFLQRVFELRRIVKDKDPDVIHAGWIQTSGFLAALSGCRPYLLMPWGSDIIHYSKNTCFNKLISAFAIHAANMITCDCEYEKRILVDDFRYPADRVVVMPWDVDRSVFYPGNKETGLKGRLGLEGKKLLLMMRIFRPEYGIEDFIRALPAVKARHPEARALMLGYGPIEKDLKSLAAESGVDDYIHWTGYVPQHEVVKYITISDVYVSTSLRDGSSSSLLEAMSCGLPVVATGIPGNVEWIQDGRNGYLVRCHDPASIAEGISRLLDDEAACRRMSADNIRTVEARADFAKNFSLLEGMYGKLAAMKKGRR